MRNKWVRRTISIGMVLFSGILLVGLFPLATTLLLMVDAVRDRRFPLLRAYLVLVFYCLWELLGITAAFLTWLLSGVWAGKNEALFLKWNYDLQWVWVNGFARMGLRLFSIRLVLDGDLPVPDRRPFLVLVRHTSLADTILATYLFRILKDYRLCYVMKRELLWDPCLDIVGNRLPNYFVDRASADTRHEADSIAALSDGLGAGEGVILWPESTRFSPAKRERVLARLKEAGNTGLLEIAERFRHVLPPRMRGITALLERNPNLDMVFCAHTGFEKAASFAALFGGSLIGGEIRARLWGYPADAVPREADALRLWVYDIWQLVDAFVGAQSHAGPAREQAAE